MESTLRLAGEKALSGVHKAGLIGEAFLLYDRELSIEVSQGEVQTLKEAEQMGLGLRVFNEGKMGFAYSTDLSDAAIAEVVRNAVHISAYTDKDEFNRLPDGNQVYPEMSTYDAGISEVEIETKIELARRVEKAARDYDPRVALVERAGYEDSEFSIFILNSSGLQAFGKGNNCGLYISLAAREDDDIQNGFAFTAQKRIALLDPKAVGEEAAMRAVRSLHARPITSDCIPCVMEPYVVTRFMGLLSSSIQADAVQKGKSMLADKVGKQVASDKFTLVDDGTFAEGLGTFPFDGEGVASQRKVIIAQGYLQGFIYDTYTSLKAGLKSTGNGMRGTFRSLPGVGTTNLILSPGEKDPVQLIGELSKGFYVTDVMGMHTANPISGDFSVGAAGIMIEKGKLTYPVRGVTIAGNLLNLLMGIDEVGSDLRFYGGKAASTVRLNRISIGGK